jgi:hypothetical protein
MKNIKILARASFYICTLVSASICYGQVPEWYQGTPFNGVAQTIPGRIEFENYDMGGEGVSFHIDLHNIAEAPIKDYRPGEVTFGAIDETNTGIHAGQDKYFDGTLYPSTENPNSKYMGWTHAGDFVRLTVYVERTDTYRISSTFAEETQIIGINIEVDGLPGTGNLNLNYGNGGFHTWKYFDNIAELYLTKGLHMLQFNIPIAHLNYDYLQFTSVRPTCNPTSINTDSNNPNTIKILFDNEPVISESNIQDINVFRNYPTTIAVDSAYIDDTNPNLMIVVLQEDILPSDNDLAISWPDSTIMCISGNPGSELELTHIINKLTGSSPELIRGETERAENMIHLQFSKKMTDPSEQKKNFVIQYNGVTKDSIVSVFLSETDSTMLLIEPYEKFISTDTLTISYNGIGFFAADGGELLAFTDYPIKNNAAKNPVISSAVTNTDGNELYLNFSAKMVDTSLKADDFKIIADGTEQEITSATFDQVGGSKITFVLSPGLNYDSQAYLIYSSGTGMSLDLKYLAVIDSMAIDNKTYLPQIIPGRIEAEYWLVNNGFQAEVTTDDGGGENVGYTNAGDYLEYLVDVQSAGVYTMEYRVAGQGNGDIQVYVDAALASDVNFNATGGWQIWETVMSCIELSEGQHILRVLANSQDFNINWYNFFSGCEESGTEQVEYVGNSENFVVYPNPVDDKLNFVSKSLLPFTVQVFNVEGSLVYSSEQNISEGLIPTELFPAGAYIVKCQSEAEVLSSKFFVLHD